MALDPAVQIGGIEDVSSANIESISAEGDGTHRPTVNGPSSVIVAKICPLEMVRRASSATRANHSSESDRYSDGGRSESHTAVPIASSCTDEACSVGCCGRSIMMRPRAPYEIGESCHPVRIPSVSILRNPLYIQAIDAVSMLFQPHTWSAPLRQVPCAT